MIRVIAYDAKSAPQKRRAQPRPLQGGTWQPAVVEQQYCHGCGGCVEKCVGKAITIE